MATTELALTGYIAQALAFGALAIFFLARQAPFYIVLSIASAASSLSGFILALQSSEIVHFGASVVFVEWMRAALWLVALIAILKRLDTGRLAGTYVQGLAIAMFLVAYFALYTYCDLRFDSAATPFIVSGGIMMGLLLIVLLEQVYRNLPSDSTPSLKYICVALFMVGGYDIFVCLRSISAGLIEADIWSARGYVNAIAVMPLALSALGGGFQPDVDTPRQMVFYRFSLLVLGGGIALWLALDYLVRQSSADWHNVTPIVLGAIAFCVTGVLLVSPSIRSRVRVFLTKFFFRYKYDYRKEWLRFISTLSESGLANVPATAVRAVGQIVNSPGGVVWVQEEEGNAYVPIGSWRCDIPSSSAISSESELVRFLIDRQWVIDLEEKQRFPARYGGLELDPELHGCQDWWLIVPLFLGKRLFGFVWLTKPRLVRKLNFEDHDLLRTVGRHVGMHINQAETDKRLAESSQFGTYNRLTAFLMHDLKNLIAQQSLVVKNAERFRDNPKFVDDAIDTIANSVSRMKRLMEQLTRGFKTPDRVKTSLRDALTDAIRRTSALRPRPSLRSTNEEIYVLGDPERLTNVFEHLIRNAQDATDDDGHIEIGIEVIDSTVCISISDTGEGMSAEFVRERLFRPFDSTKGSHAMGIGAYQAREYVRMMGGQLQVESSQGKGAVFTLQLPAAQ